MPVIQLWRVMEMPSTDAESYGFCEPCGMVQPLAENYTDKWVKCAFCGNTETETCQTVGDILDAKRADDDYLTLLEHIKQNGMRKPILIQEGYVCNGHHRIAAYEDLGMDRIEYTEDVIRGWDESWTIDYVSALV